ncbi:MAG: MFS transporter [Propionibacteriaceae bacterium]|nr:MFS transporter [Propionibacteriaceae bacterium]
MYPRVSLASGRAVAAVVVLFAYNGLVLGVYAASIPLLRDKIGLDAIRMAILFVLTGVAAVTTMQFSGRIADKHGARRVCLAMIAPMILAAIGYALVPTYPLLLITGIFLGIGNGGIDVAMNALAVQVERRRLTPVTPRDAKTPAVPIMSFFHGMWAVGSLAGSLGVSVVGTVVGRSPHATLAVCALTAAGLGVVVLGIAFAITPETQTLTHTKDGQKSEIPRAAYLMGLMAIAFGLGEGTASDWAGAHVQMIASVDPRTAAWAVTAMMACMVIIRLTGDRLVARLGRRRLVRLGGVVAAIGYLTLAFATGFPILIAGWAVVGLGMGVIAPQVYASAGHLAGGRGLAVVVSFGYTTFLVGPAIIGTLAHFIGIGYTMALPGVLLLGLVALVPVALKDDYLRAKPESTDRCRNERH